MGRVTRSELHIPFSQSLTTDLLLARISLLHNRLIQDLTRPAFLSRCTGIDYLRVFSRREELSLNPKESNPASAQPGFFTRSTLEVIIIHLHQKIRLLELLQKIGLIIKVLNPPPISRLVKCEGKMNWQFFEYFAMQVINKIPCPYFFRLVTSYP